VIGAVTRGGPEGRGGGGYMVERIFLSFFYSLLNLVHSSRRCAQINLGLLESSRASEGLVMAPLIGLQTSTEYLNK